MLTMVIKVMIFHSSETLVDDPVSWDENQKTEDDFFPAHLGD